MDAVKIEGLCKNYKEFKLDNVSFEIPEGTIMGLIGENGAGKSTVINLITGACIKDSGNIEIYGTEADKMPVKDREIIGTVFAGCGFPDEMTVNEVNGILKSIYDTWDEEKFFGYIEKFGIMKKGKIRSFSTGMRMKLEIAAAFSHGAKLLILDEATNGLDPAARMEILDMLMDFIQDERCAVLISSHIVGDLEKICDYITFIHNGRVIFSENKDELLEKYAVINVSEKQLSELDSDAVVAEDRTKWSNKALVYKSMIPEGFEKEKTTVEDIMLYYIKRSER